MDEEVGMFGVRMTGLILALLGTLATIFPEWFGALTGGPEPPIDAFEAIERRVRGGMVLGVGLASLAIGALRPWSMSIPSAIFYVMTGALAARILGILLHGVVPKQWLLVAIEVLVMALIALWQWYSDAGAAP